MNSSNCCSVDLPVKSQTGKGRKSLIKTWWRQRGHPLVVPSKEGNSPSPTTNSRILGRCKYFAGWLKRMDKALKCYKIFVFFQLSVAISLLWLLLPEHTPIFCSTNHAWKQSTWSSLYTMASVFLLQKKLQWQWLIAIHI